MRTPSAREKLLKAERSPERIEKKSISDHGWRRLPGVADDTRHRRRTDICIYKRNGDDDAVVAVLLRLLFTSRLTP